MCLTYLCCQAHTTPSTAKGSHPTFHKGLKVITTPGADATLNYSWGFFSGEILAPKGCAVAAGLTLGLGHEVSFAMDSISQFLGFAVPWLSITSLTHFFVPLTSSSPSHHTWLFLSPLIPLQAQISAEALPHFPFPKMRIPKLPQIPNLQAFTPSPPNTELFKTNARKCCPESPGKEDWWPQQEDLWLQKEDLGPGMRI